jgi:hypothetical protein
LQQKPSGKARIVVEVRDVQARDAILSAIRSAAGSDDDG